MSEPIEQLDIKKVKRMIHQNKLYGSATVNDLVAEIERLQHEIDSHGPEGRNYTNLEYITLLTEHAAMKEELEYIRPMVDLSLHSEPVGARRQHNQNESMRVLHEVSELISWRYEGEHSRIDALKLIYAYVGCCDKPNVQKFGPNETIQSSTSVCINCGKMWGINTGEKPNEE